MKQPTINQTRTLRLTGHWKEPMLWDGNTYTKPMMFLQGNQAPPNRCLSEKRLNRQPCMGLTIARNLDSTELALLP